MMYIRRCPRLSKLGVLGLGLGKVLITQRVQTKGIPFLNRPRSTIKKTDDQTRSFWGQRNRRLQTKECIVRYCKHSCKSDNPSYPSIMSSYIPPSVLNIQAAKHDWGPGNLILPSRCQANGTNKPRPGVFLQPPSSGYLCSRVLGCGL